MDSLFVYVTCPNDDIAAVIAKDVVQKRYAACANLFPKIRSFYWWDGAVQDEGEVVVVMKTDHDNWPLLKKAILAVHPYEVPCIVALPIEHGHEPYLAWIKEQVREPS